MTQKPQPIEEALGASLLNLELDTKVIEEKVEAYLLNIKRAKKEHTSTEQEHEEHFKTHLNRFLDEVFGYKNNTHERIDAVIKEGESVRTLIEVKRPSNQKEMVQAEDLNRKAFHEALLYYYEQRKNGVATINHILITDCEKFYLIEASVFEGLIRNKKVSTLLQGFKDETLDIIRTTNDLYNALQPILAHTDIEIPYTFFDITGEALDPSLLYKLFSEYTLFKKPLANDANSINPRFYNELLHILGLKESSKKSKGGNEEGKNTKVTVLEYSGVKNTLLDLTQEIVKNKTPNEDIFETALSLNILWLNRILFLKLLESQLKTVRNNKDFSLLNPDTAADSHFLYNLFFNVLNKPRGARNPDDEETYKYVPYLNSSLFVPAPIEDKFDISSINGKRKVVVLSNSILGDKYQKKELPLWEYFLRFLNCFQFNREAEGADPHTVIKSSVLGLVFEKLNNYKDGAHFTPSAITMYMCQETVHKQVLLRFNKAYGQSFTNIAELASYCKKNINKAEDIAQAKGLIDAITIIDPAVGSGHFLVSALNELIRTKSFLGLLHDDISVDTENDELVISYRNGHPFVYAVENGAISAVQAEIQQLIFNTKKHIIENQLFGVDINPNSVNICRLRLWIELLKHSYFTDSKLMDMEALPNLEFKIMTADSLLPLVKRTEASFLTSTDFELKKNELTRKFSQYFNAKGGDKEAIKQGIGDTLESMKGMASFSEGEGQGKLLEEFTPFDTNICAGFFDAPFMFGRDKFDICIMNPPYFGLSKNHPYQSFMKTGDIYQIFIERAEDFIVDTQGNSEGIVAAVISNKWMRAGYGARTRGWLKNRMVHEVIDLGPKWFDSATVDTCIISYGVKGTDKTVQDKITAYALKPEHAKKDINNSKKDLAHNNTYVFIGKGSDEAPWLVLSEAEASLLNKMKMAGKPLSQWDISINRGVLTGLNEAFIIDGATKDALIAEDAKSAEIIKPVLKGEDIRRYGVEFADRWLIGTLPALNIDIDNYPAIKKHLEAFRPRIEQTGKEGSRKLTPHKWFETQDIIAYYKNFEKPKIIWAETMRVHKGETAQRFPRFTYSTTKEYTDKTCFIVTGQKLPYLTAILNSQVIEYYIRKNVPVLDTGGFLMQKIYVEQLPIPLPTPEMEAQITALVERILQDKKDKGMDARSAEAGKDANAPAKDTSADENEIDRLVYQLYGLDEAEIRIVEG